jgi:hypothetical protein
LAMRTESPPDRHRQRCRRKWSLRIGTRELGRSFAHGGSGACGDRDTRAATRPSRQRPVAEAKNDHVPFAQARRHRSFKVVSPNNTRAW